MEDRFLETAFWAALTTSSAPSSPPCREGSKEKEGKQETSASATRPRTGGFLFSFGKAVSALHDQRLRRQCELDAFGFEAAEDVEVHALVEGLELPPVGRMVPVVDGDGHGRRAEILQVDPRRRTGRHAFVVVEDF